MAKNSLIDHDTATEMLNTFTALTRNVERKATIKLRKPLNADSQRRIVQWADREITITFGHPLRALFEIV